MNRVILCAGAYASQPYRIRHIKTDIYCMEELCYYLCEYTNLLEDDLKEEPLISWIEAQCALPKLAARLREICQRGEPLSAFVGAILEASDYADRDRIEQIRETLRQDEALGGFARRKKQADHLIKEGKLYYGLDLYHQLIREIPREESRLLADVLYNCGSVYAKLFYYEIAAGLFERAIALQVEDSDIREAFLYCKRAVLKKQKYVDFIAEHPEFYEDSLSLEHKILNLKTEWEKSEENEELTGLFAGREESGFVGLRQKVQEKIQQWENCYIGFTGNNM